MNYSSRSYEQNFIRFGAQKIGQHNKLFCWNNKHLLDSIILNHEQFCSKRLLDGQGKQTHSGQENKEYIFGIDLSTGTQSLQ